MSYVMDHFGLDPERRADCERTDRELNAHVHPTMAQVLNSFATCSTPSERTDPALELLDGALVPLASLNDDDIYVVNLRQRLIVDHFGSSSVIGQTIKSGTQWPIRLGCALLTGMQAKGVLS